MAETEPIAIIGTGCRFPGGVSSPSELWSLLKGPRDLSQRIPHDRFNGDAFYHPEGKHHGTSNVPQAYFLYDGIRSFDASFFNISAREADGIDPQQRLVLETVYEALERAGLRPSALRGSSTGVFCGVMCDDYWQILARDVEQLPQYTSTGVARNNVSNRVSYFFDWHGPSITVDTACSSSLVAVHLAVQAIRDGSCRVAVASGTNLIASPYFFMAASKLNMLSPTGRSRMWDVAADGYARGEGVASVVLKRLSHAIADGDPVECVIRATGVNQDGRTMGITMPSSVAQTQLIRSTYEKAGLCLDRAEDRCQYFEAHGTGTQAGDPQEAAAIAGAFFPKMSDPGEAEELLVGSVKTVIGHTEGTAGLAGLIKASLCIQHGEIVPNLHLDTLNPKVKPFYSHLRIPTEVEPWPQLPPGVPRRASVNSFGFGGTNAHAILENYPPPAQPNGHRVQLNGHQAQLNGHQAQLNGHRAQLNGHRAQLNGHRAQLNGHKDAHDLVPGVHLPFVFSAASDLSLGASLERWARYLTAPTTPTIDHASLADVLFSRRDDFTHRLVLRASSTPALISELAAELGRRKQHKPSTVLRRPAGTGPNSPPRILAIFSGQGAQWPRMGAELVETCPAARAWMQELQASLDALPARYRPQYSLLAELCAPPETSRLGQAAIAQPLCTALQIVLVNLVRAVGLAGFSAVVGHSSGEIAAAYAAGFLSAADAIRVAHLRGLFAKLASGPGAMLAVGLSVEEAEAFCVQERFRGRITVAAFNSDESATLSGNADAIAEAAEMLVAQGKFARMLRVDTAYHSHHMAPCGSSYLGALGQSVVGPGGKGSPSAAWFSSVHAGQRVEGDLVESLKDVYWNDNMQKPVMFAQALTAAITESGPFDLLLELGPHPALKGPVMQIMSSSGGSISADIPYTSLLQRGSSAQGTIASALGSLWTYLGSDSCNLASYTQLFGGAHTNATSLSLLKTIPTYAFDHTQTYWAESRVSKSLSQRPPPNLLLGVQLLDVASDGEWRWRNFLRRDEIEWLDGHQIEHQTVYPATGYVAMALEAAQVIAGDTPLRAIEICDFHIAQALSLDTDSAAGVETVFKVDRLGGDKSTGRLAVSFACHAAFGAGLRRCAYGNMDLLFGQADPSLLLPSQDKDSQGLSPVGIDGFYKYLDGLGYGYTGLFRGITALNRKLNTATGHMINAARLEPAAATGSPPPLMMHPATMDTLLQTVLAAIGAPHDGRLNTVHVPTKIERISINALFSGGGAGLLGNAIAFEARLTDYSPGNIQGDAAAFDDAGNCAVRMEGVRVSPLAAPSPADDRLLFSETVWGPLVPDVALAHELPDTEARRMAELKEKLVLLYMRCVQETLTQEDHASLGWHAKKIVGWIEHVLELTRSGHHPVCKSEWLQESLDSVMAELDMATVDMRAVRLLGEHLTSALRGQVQTQKAILQVLQEHELLDRLSSDHLQMVLPREDLARVASQLTFRFPHMKILELGSGTGLATEAVLDGIGRSYYSYTVTDTHSTYFEVLQSRFAEHSDRMLYKTLDIEKDLAQQGCEESSYHLIVACSTLHTAASLQETLTRVRSLLKPGGYLLLVEGTNPFALLSNFIYCGFEKHWVGEADGRTRTPLVTAQIWDSLLRATGFSGTDTVSHGHETELQSLSVILSQAVDPTMTFLRNPLQQHSQGDITPVQLRNAQLVILPPTTASPQTTSLLSNLTTLLTPYFTSITTLTLPTTTTTTTSTLNALPLPDTSSSPNNITTLCLTDLDSPSSLLHASAHLTPTTFAALQRLADASARLLWVTSSTASNPHAALARGLLASLAYENPLARYQLLEIVDVDGNQGLITDAGRRRLAEVTAAQVLRLGVMATEEPTGGGKDDFGLGSRVWAAEGEVRFEGGRLWVPRVRWDAERNGRYMANRREVEEVVDCRVTPVVVDDDKKRLVRGGERGGVGAVTSGQGGAGIVTVRTRYALSAPLRFVEPGQVLYPVVGTCEEESGLRVLALAEANGSIITTRGSWCWPLPSHVSEEDEAAYLYQTVVHVLSAQLVGVTTPNSIILVLGADAALLTAITACVSASGIRVVFLEMGQVPTQTPQRASSAEVCCVTVHPMMSTRELAKLVSMEQVSVVARLGGCSEITEVWSRLDSLLPRHVRRETLEGLLAAPVSMFSGPRHGSLLRSGLACLETARDQPADRATLAAADDEETIGKVVVDVQSLDGSDSTLRVVDWTRAEHVRVKIQPASSQVSLSAHKTYLLVGMTGDLGRSICRWLVGRGARHIVLTSRNPKIEEWWLDEMKSLGAHVITMSMDVSDATSVLAVDRAIRSTLPPLGGVINGAMILLDKLFTSMTLSDWQRTNRPKVDGSLLLSELCADGDPNLDFFILMGSITGPLGNASQSAYAAANTFMAGLVAWRRARGLVGSVVSPAQILGVGYVAHAGNAWLLDHLEKTIGCYHVSEHDLHELVAEGILAGRPGPEASGRNSAEVIAGFRLASPAAQKDIIWYRNPKMWHFVRHSLDEDGSASAIGKGAATTGRVSVKEQLAGAASLEEAVALVEAGFTTRLRSKLQLAKDVQIVREAAPAELGVDSLVAVDLRSWFVKDVGVDVPVLKILGGMTLGQLAAEAANKVWKLELNDAGTRA